MADGTKIEWADTSWSPITGCTKISEGCANCYAERMAKRLAGRFGYNAEKPFKVTMHPDRLGKPRHWRKPRRVFVCSMGDLFHEDVPFSYVTNVWNAMEHARKHTFMVLTKRPERMREYCSTVAGRFAVRGYMTPLPNVWLGVTAENQRRADERIPVLLETPAAVRFISAEPLLEDIFLPIRNCPASNRCDFWIPKMKGCAGCATSQDIGIDWLIVGAETGPGARPMDPLWARYLLEQCQQGGVPFFFKRDSNGNRTLDGEMWEQYPEVP